MFGFLDWTKIGAGAAVGAALLIAPAYFKARRPAVTRLPYPSKPPSKFSERKARSMLPLCALITGCQTTNKRNACDGFAPFRPSWKRPSTSFRTTGYSLTTWPHTIAC